MKKIKMIKYDECYLYATDECMEFNATADQLRAMLSATIHNLIKKGRLTKEEVSHDVELALLDDDKLEEKITEAISNLLSDVSNAIKDEKPKKKQTKKEGKK